MQYDEPKPNEAADGLSPAQSATLDAMLAGKTIAAAAEAAGVARATVHRWLKDDFVFQAELNRGRRELRRATFGSLERLAVKAAHCIEKAIDEGDVKAAMEILKRSQLLALSPIGSDDPSQLAAEAKAQAAEAELKATEAEVAAVERQADLAERARDAEEAVEVWTS